MKIKRLDMGNAFNVVATNASFSREPNPSSGVNPGPSGQSSTSESEEVAESIDTRTHRFGNAHPRGKSQDQSEEHRCCNKMKSGTPSDLVASRASPRANIFSAAEKGNEDRDSIQHPTHATQPPITTKRHYFQKSGHDSGKCVISPHDALSSFQSNSHDTNPAVTIEKNPTCSTAEALLMLNLRAPPSTWGKQKSVGKEAPANTYRMASSNTSNSLEQDINPMGAIKKSNFISPRQDLEPQDNKLNMEVRQSLDDMTVTGLGVHLIGRRSNQAWECAPFKTASKLTPRIWDGYSGQFDDAEDDPTSSNLKLSARIAKRKRSLSNHMQREPPEKTSEPFHRRKSQKKRRAVRKPDRANRQKKKETVMSLNQQGENVVVQVRGDTSKTETATKCMRENSSFIQVRENDVLFGRGTSVHLHPGNMKFRAFCWQARERYRFAERYVI